MSEDNYDLSEATTSLPIAVILGLKTPVDMDWSGLRAFQHAHFGRRALARLTVHALAAILLVSSYFGKTNPLMLSAWLFALSAALVHSVRLERLRRANHGRGRQLPDVLTHAMGGMTAGAVWAFALIFFPPFGSLSDLMAIWAGCTLLIIGSILGRSSMPLGSLAFICLVSLAGMVSFMRAGEYAMACVVFAYALLGMLRTVDGARLFLATRIAQARVAEKAEVVSLLLREFEENEADWLWEIDTNKRLRSVSPRFAFALGRDPREVVGQPFLQMISGPQWETGDLPPSLHQLADRFKARESFANLIVKVLIDGQSRWWELSGTPIHDETGAYLGFRGVGSDVTAQRESSDQVAYLARYDVLTKLPNRLMLNEALGEALKHAERWGSRCALLMVDLDRFKSINDSLGHQVGDQMLAQVSDRLRALMADGELCGRLGGDEFGVVLHDAEDNGRIAILANGIIERLSEPYQVDNHILYVGASVGSAVGPRDGETVEQLLRSADLALYRAKETGGGSHFSYMPSFHQVAEERRILEVSLRHALERNEFLLHFQPVVDANSEQLVSFEALVRWNSPEHGMVSPTKFIPIAEDTRLIVAIGQWVLQQACVEASRWPEQLRIAVNVSPEQLLEPGFSESVVRALSISGLSPQRLEVEVTESIFLRDASVARNALEQVMALGCQVALDDFGTGYSSLGYLRKLRFSTIKIDRTFVRGAAQDSAESLAIVRAVVAMAQSLGMTTTAEGVETGEEVNLLRNLGCTKIQGYYFGRPMSAENARKVVARLDQKRA